MLVILPWKLLTIAVYNPIWCNTRLCDALLVNETSPLNLWNENWVNELEDAGYRSCRDVASKNAGCNASNSWRILTLDWLFTQLGGKKMEFPISHIILPKNFQVYPAVKSSVAWHFPNDGIRPRRCIVHWCINLISISQVHPATSSRKDLVASHACELSWVAVPACYEEAPKCCYRWKTHLSSCTRTSMSCFAPVGSRKSQIQSCKGSSKFQLLKILRFPACSLLGLHRFQDVWRRMFSQC